jgi:CHAT domain-containing protein/tetratricopeptide (TPR) repeat protein
MSCSTPSDSDLPLHTRAMAVVGRARPFDIRLFGGQQYSSCSADRRARLIPSVSCLGTLDSRAREMASKVSVDIRRALARQPTTDALWSAALVDLWSARSQAYTIDRVIGRLIEVRARDTTNTAVLNDLAIAYLIRASDRESAFDLFTALEYVEQAYGRDSVSPVIRFDRAVILERARMDDQAAAAWQKATADASDPWAAEARERYHRLIYPDSSARVRVVTIDSASIDGGLVESLVRRDPQTAREYVLDTLVLRWSRATLAGDSAAAAGVATRCAAIGRAIVALSGDSSVSHVALEIGRSVSSRIHRVMAVALARGVDGMTEFRQTSYTQAEPNLKTATKALRREASPRLADWVELPLAAVQVQRAKYPEAERIFTAISRRAKSGHDVALEARAFWGLALSQSRRGATSATEKSYSVAVADFARLGETSNVGFMQALIADTHHALGRPAAHAQSMYAALDAFHRRADTALRYSVLLALGQRLADDGLQNAAVVAIREAVLAAPTTGRAKDIPESFARLAYEEVQLGNYPEAKRSIAIARNGLSSIADSVMHGRLDVEIARAEAAALRSDDPRRSLERLDYVAGYFERVGIPTDYAPTLIRRADVRLAIGDSSGALRDLDLATGVVTRLVSLGADRETIRRLIGTQSDVYRRLVAVSLARADTAAAYRYAELSREDTIVSRPSGASESQYPASDHATLAYLLVGDRLLIWTLGAGGGTPMLTTVQITPRALEELVTRFVNLIREDADTVSEGELGRRLYDVLLAPVRDRLAGAQRLVLVPDGSISDVPFAALRDPQRRYLIRDFALTYAPAAGRPTHTRESARSRGGGALLVGNPAWERSFFPDLDVLRSAESEVDGIRKLYVRPTLLNGKAATRAAFLAELPRHELVHFAGHARVSHDEPMSSHLVLAGDTTGFGDNVVFASDIVRLDLRAVRLIVLSACGEPRGPYAGSVRNGLVQAFLDAGVGGVIASQWEADDEATAALMRVLHRELTAGRSGDEALRGAQLTFLKDWASADVTTRPKTWATFRFNVASR